MAEKDKLAELHDFLKHDVEVSSLDGDVIDVAMDVISKHIEMIKKLEKQNKRYREKFEYLLEEAKDHKRLGLKIHHWALIKDLEKALESESND